MNLLGRVQQKTLARAPNISVHVPLDTPNVNFNFAALAEEKYGWDALHPVAARLRALNRYESDEESDSEIQVVVAADGTNGHLESGVNPHRPPGEDGNSTESAQPSRKKRKKRKDMEYYDVTDPFIDDDELLLQERTAASKDGFFVFSGPLVAEGERVRIEKIDGTQKRAGAKGSRTGRNPRPRPTSITNGSTKTPKTPRVLPDKKDLPATIAPFTNVGKSSGSDTPIAQGNVETMGPPLLVTSVSKGSTTNGKSTVPNGKKTTQSARKENHGAKKTKPDPNPTVEPSVALDKVVVNSPREPDPMTPETSEKAGLHTTSEPKTVKKKVPSTVSVSKKNKTKSNAESLANTITRLPAVDSASPSGSPAISLAGSPALNSDGTVKKQRKPTRERTVEEKADLARKARESRERKKLEKKLQEDAERAALLARAIANPNIDTRGISFASPAGISPTPFPAASKARVKQVNSKARASPQTPGPSLEMQALKQEFVDITGGTPTPFTKEAQQSGDVIMRDLVMPKSKILAEITRTDSPSGRSMSVDALLE